MSRFSVTSVLDVSSLSRYYGRMDVYLSFTDDVEFDRNGSVDRNIRPYGVFAYPINDVVGRRSRQSTLYGRVLRFSVASDKILESQKYRADDYELDYQKLVKMNPKDEVILDEIYTLVPGQLRIRTAFAHLWQLTFRYAARKARAGDGIRKEWTRILQELGYQAVFDERGNGVLTTERRAAIVIFNESEIEDLEVVSTQRYKKEQNSRMMQKVERFNSLTKVSNARRRIAKW